ncbi:MAG TPA: hypothetical protein VM925_02880 [Labilithrix sp.]|nr:hypothetical protein [Labilithrix sp.]
MRILVRGSAGLAFVMLIVSCSSLLKKKGEEDAGLEASVTTEVADAAPAPAPAALATNEGDIARFPDETKVADVAVTLQRTYNVREAPPAGVIIMGLGKGTAVTQIAQREKSFLILFDNPKAPGTKLMGWIHRDAFSAVVQDAGPLVCPKGEIALFGDTPFCGKVCSTDPDCPPGQACKGPANKLLPSGKAGDGVTVCTLFHPHDAGAPTPTPDAGKAPVADAGKADAAPAPAVDAGPAPTPDAGPAPRPVGEDVVPATNGKCQGNFVFVTKTGKCHRPCPAGPTGGQCASSKSVCIKCNKEETKVCAVGQADCR